MTSRLILVRGRIQKHGEIIHVVAERLEDRTWMLDLLSEDGMDTPTPLARADEVRRPATAPYPPQGKRASAQPPNPRPQPTAQPLTQPVSGPPPARPTDHPQVARFSLGPVPTSVR